MLSTARRAEHGYTLIETAVAMAVFAVAVMTAAPYLSAWNANTQTRGGAEALLAGLQKTRMEAIRRNQVVRFSLVATTDARVLDASCALSASSWSWVISRNDPSGKCDVAVSDSVDPLTIESLAAGPAAARVQIAAVDGAGDPASTVMFDGFGRVVGGGIARIDLRHPSNSDDYRRLRVLVNNNGVRLCDPAVTAAGDPRRC